MSTFLLVFERLQFWDVGWVGKQFQFSFCHLLSFQLLHNYERADDSNFQKTWTGVVKHHWIMLSLMKMSGGSIWFSRTLIHVISVKTSNILLQDRWCSLVWYYDFVSKVNYKYLCCPNKTLKVFGVGLKTGACPIIRVMRSICWCIQEYSF